MANTVDKVLAIAEAEVGYLEKKSNANLYDKTANAGAANYTKYGKEMHDIYPSVMDFPAAWCDCFVDWCFYKAYGITNAKALIGGNFNDYTPSSAQLYKNKNTWYTSPKKGDQIFFKNSTRICHTGLVYKVDSTYVYTIEGNTSGASGVVANGGGVCKKKYKLNYSKIAGYGRPKYDVATRNYLMKGDNGAEVKALQENLIFIGYSCGSVGADGDFGNGTDSAVRKFQKDNGLVVDGKYGASSKAKLEALVTEKKKPITPTTSATYSRTDFIKDVQRAIGTTADGIVGSKTLGLTKNLLVSKSKNNRHAVVKPLQKYLNVLGYNAGTPDGIFGSKSHNAVVAYQKTNGLSADGIIGQNTWKKLLK